MAKILVVEDDRQVRSVLRHVLELKNHEVMEAQNGKEGLLLFRQENPDLIIIDLIMPEKDGLELIMELGPSSSHTKIIAISGGGNIKAEQYLDVAHKLGASKVFSKPIGARVLLEAVKQLVP